ncbi:aldose 1-epimerase family protein [Pseudokineococcus sp. 1T1Z-3]|uniref:aldose 1-epimerase family protein n=1 Tax=Pseudokineococcus sp. 1T1Z-3 TaxID=3132745 RepID=UPI00309FEEEB
MDEVTIASQGLSVVVARQGAELQSLRLLHDDGSEGLELLWQAGPQWRRRAPVLFPVVGKVADDEVIVDGRRYPMGQHGFARDLPHEVLEASPSRVVLRLADDGTTREHYPFGFALTTTFEVQGRSLTARWAVETTGETPMPFSLGWHPAFRWPLAPGVPKGKHVVLFEEPEPADVRRVRGGPLTEPVPTPVLGDLLPLSDGLFSDDAVVFDDLRSTAVTFTGPGAPTLRLHLDGFPQLGVWSRPTGADFLCLEPWAGLASPEGWQGELRDKPYGQVVAPGEVFEVGCTVTVERPGS